jgi:hypothetical protein
MLSTAPARDFTVDGWQACRPAIFSPKGVRCWKCGHVFIEYLTAPYRYVCHDKRCKAVNEDVGLPT